MSRVWLLSLLCLAIHAESLFDGKSLQGWKETPFSQHGPVRVEDGAIVLGAGSPFTGARARMFFVSSMPSICAIAMPPEDGGGMPQTVHDL